MQVLFKRDTATLNKIALEAQEPTFPRELVVADDGKSFFELLMESVELRIAARDDPARVVVAIGGELVHLDHIESEFSPIFTADRATCDIDGRAALHEAQRKNGLVMKAHIQLFNHS